MKDLMYLLKDKNSKSIKQDSSGMLCMFTSKAKAERFLNRLHKDDKADSEIMAVKCSINAI